MFSLVLLKLFFWSRCWYISVVDAQPGDQSLKHEEHQLGIKQCEERCLDIGECRGFSYDSSALRCSLAFEEDNFQYNLTARKCGTSWCKRGERCLKTRKSRYVCVSYLTQEEEHLPEKEVQLDLEDLGSVKTDLNFFACDVTRVYQPVARDYVFLLSVNQLIAIDMKNLTRSHRWPFVSKKNLRLIGLMSSFIKASPSIKESFIFIIISSKNNKHTCLLSIKDRKLFTMKTIDLTSNEAVGSMMNGNQLHRYVDKLFHISTRPGRHHELSLAKLEIIHQGNNALKQCSSVNTGFVNVTDTPVNFFAHDMYLFVLVKNVLLRWRRENTGSTVINNDSMRMYRWDGPRNAVSLSVYQGQTLYILDEDNHLRKVQINLLLKQLRDLDN